MAVPVSAAGTEVLQSAQRRLLSALSNGGVDYVLIGGVAGRLHGASRATDDLDIAPDASGGNLGRLVAALHGLDAVLVTGAGPDPSVPLDEELLFSRQVLSLLTREGRIDLVWEPPGAAGYALLAAEGVPMTLDADGVTVEVTVASVAALIAMKSATGRAKDREVIAELRAKAAS